MKYIKNLFWNTDEARLRAAYRIILQLTVFFIVMKGLKYIFGIPNEISSNTPLWIFFAIAIVRLFRVLISVFLVGRFLDRRLFTDFGLRINKKWWIDLCFGMGLGILLMGSIFLIELSANWITISETMHTANPDQSFIVPFIVFFILFVCAGFSEELFYRGYHLTNLAEGFNIKAIGAKNAIIIAVIISSLLFGVFHLGSPNASIVSTTNIILYGVLFCIPYVLTGRLAISVGLHITWNLFQGNVFGFPISGTSFPSETVSFFSIIQSGPDSWTGGAFGPEAGLLTLCSLVVGIILILGWVKYREGGLKINLAIAKSPEKLKK